MAEEVWRGVVRKTLEKLDKKLEVESAIVFGSWSREGGGEWSDVDLLVVTDGVKNVNVLDRFYIAVECKAPRMDLFLYTYKELEGMAKKGNPLALSALVDGLPIKLSERVSNLIEYARRRYERRGRFYVEKQLLQR
jgi:predicted nucleotidyltransferase